jgi:hypothetical protein
MLIFTFRVRYSEDSPLPTNPCFLFKFPDGEERLVPAVRDNSYDGLFSAAVFIKDMEEFEYVSKNHQFGKYHHEGFVAEPVTPLCN